MINFESDLKSYLLFLLSDNQLQAKYKIIKTQPSDKDLAQKTTHELINIYLYYFSRFANKPCNVIISDEMKNNELFKKYKKEINNVVKTIESNTNINQYLPKNIGNIIYCDKLLSDWGITHYHIFELEKRKNNPEDKYIIYSISDTETVLLIDIQDHKHFLEKSLLEIIDRYNPKYLMKANNINGELFEKPIINNLRKNGVGYLININGQAFPAGMKKMLYMTFSSQILSMIKSLQKEFELNFDSFIKELQDKYSNIKETNFQLHFDFINHDVYVLETYSKTGCSWESKVFMSLKQMCFNSQLL